MGGASLAILTEKRYLNPKKNSGYVDNILTEDFLVQVELEKLGISCSRVAWDDNFNPSKFRFALFRTTWNYFEKLPFFLKFLHSCTNKTQLINPYNQIIWNLDKKYLLDLHFAGINIPPTLIVKKGNQKSLSEFCKKNKWTEVVIKPCVSAAAWNTHHIKKTHTDSANKLFFDLNQRCDMMVQCFQQNIKKSGEISLMMIGGCYSHAVLKRAKTGDFRVQDDFGGTVCSYEPTMMEVDFAQQVLDALFFQPIYARVDIIFDNNNNLALTELELIEPEMWFRLNPDSPKKLAQHILRHIKS